MSDLEDAAQECIKVAQRQNNVWAALLVQDCALRIRHLPSWKGHDNGKECQRKGCLHK